MVEKEERLVEERVRLTNERRGLRFLFCLIVTAFCFLLWNSGHPLVSITYKNDRIPSPTAKNGDDFDWYNVYPSEKLRWVDCYEKLHCARLEVPLDYSRPHEEKAAIALIRYPSKYAVDDPRWKGPILYNPGGPGASGVETILTSGAYFAEVIGDEYDHVGFDPRGIGKTTPAFNLFPTRMERMTWDLQNSLALDPEDHFGFSRAVINSELIGELAEEKTSVGNYMSTPIVARDMKSILKAYGRTKLMYWGFSYGTTIGMTFASMFPNNVERMLLDGVMDVNNYYEGLWSNSLIDMESVYENILTSCISYPECAFYSPNSTSTDLRKRLDNIFESLKERPIKVLISSSSSEINYGLIDREFARLALFKVLYHPRQSFLQLAEALKALEEGNGRPLWEFEKKKDSLERCECGLPPVNEFIVPETMRAVTCSDGETGRSDVESLKEFYRELESVSSFGEFWGTRLACHGWKTKAVERYNGTIGGRTSYPIMFIGNTADPVTPLAFAKKMSKEFEGAVYLTQNSTGHCSTSAPSLCTSKHIRTYFKDGTLPPEGTICQKDTPMFGNASAYKVHLMSLSSEKDRKLARAAKGLSETLSIPYLGL